MKDTVELHCLTTGRPPWLCWGIIGVWLCLFGRSWPGLVRLVVLRSDQLHKALVAHIGRFLDA